MVPDEGHLVRLWTNLKFSTPNCCCKSYYKHPTHTFLGLQGKRLWAPRSTFSKLWLHGSVEDQGYARRTEKIEELLSCHSGSMGICRTLYLDKCRNRSVHVYLCIYIHIRTYVRRYTSMLFVIFKLYVCMYMYTYMCIYIYATPPSPCTYPFCCLRNQPA